MFGLMAAVPGVGVPLHAACPFPVTPTFAAEERPPPVIAIFPLYDVIAVGVNLT
jgi:hypothetical protein